MQIHEIARRKINEGILKGVATNIAKGAVNTVKPVVNYAVDQAENLQRKLLNAIRTRDSGKFARSVRRTNADT